MNKTTHILIIGLIISAFSCNQTRENKPIAKDSSQANIDKKEQERIEKRKQLEEEQRLDSLRLDKVLNEALKVAKQNLQTKTFFKEYEQTVGRLYNATTNISVGNFFSKTTKHVIIRRTVPGSVFINIYLVEDDNLKLVIYHEQDAITYTNDTIRDVNGDGKKDFIVNWYGSSGCCLKAFSNVYLFRTSNATFSDDLEFINPTFSATEKIIRGVCYGHPGETEMYKYKWKGEAVDTLEYIYFEKNAEGVKTGKIIRSNRRPFEGNVKTLQLLSSIPKEYRSIEGYDWFTGAGY